MLLFLLLLSASARLLMRDIYCGICPSVRLSTQFWHCVQTVHISSNLFSIWQGRRYGGAKSSPSAVRRGAPT